MLCHYVVLCCAILFFLFCITLSCVLIAALSRVMLRCPLSCDVMHFAVMRGVIFYCDVFYSVVFYRVVFYGDVLYSVELCYSGL